MGPYKPLPGSAPLGGTRLRVDKHGLAPLAVAALPTDLPRSDVRAAYLRTASLTEGHDGTLPDRFKSRVCIIGPYSRVLVGSNGEVWSPYLVSALKLINNNNPGLVRLNINVFAWVVFLDLQRGLHGSPPPPNF